jgi:hypothetical protein
MPSTLLNAAGMIGEASQAGNAQTALQATLQRRNRLPAYWRVSVTVASLLAHFTVAV